MAALDQSGSELAYRLKASLATEAIYPAFQPIVSLRTRSISSFEVLARWRDPVFGDVSPTAFIPVAESEGLLRALTADMIGSACSAARCWQGGFRLAFNISPLQFHDEHMPTFIEDAVRRTGFPLERIQVEITEGAVIGDLDSARSKVASLKHLGVRIVLDDFGTGYSSLTRLQALPFDNIKIDASFVRAMCEERDCRKIVSAVIGLGQSLGMPVVAEGVETEAQARMLLNLGCDYGQGWLFGRPVTANEVPALLRRYGEQAHDPSPLDMSCNQRLAQLAALYASAPVGLCFLNPSLRFVSANRLYGELFDLDVERIIGLKIEDVLPYAMPFVRADLDTIRAGGELRPVEQVLKDGVRTALISVTPARDENGDLIGLSVAIIETTRRQRTPDAGGPKPKPARISHCAA